MEPLKSLAGSPRVRPARLRGPVLRSTGSSLLAGHPLLLLQHPSGGDLTLRTVCPHGSCPKSKLLLGKEYQKSFFGLLRWEGKCFLILRSSWKDAVKSTGFHS